MTILMRSNAKKQKPAVVYQDEQNRVVLSRFDGNSGTFNLLEQMIVEPGTIDDWHLLHKLHYKAENLPVGSKIYRCRLGSRTIGVCTLGLPRLTLKARRHLLPNLKTGGVKGGFTRLVNTDRAVWLNKHMVTNGRVVVDTMFRGVGIAYRMQNLAFRMHGKKYVEFQSSMSKYNKFAEKAGIKMIKPMRGNVYEKGLEFFRQYFDNHPADFDAIMTELEQMPKVMRRRVENELRLFYRRNSSLENAGVGGNIKAEKKVAEMRIEDVLKNLQQLVFASPLYGIYENPDHGRELPKQLPLLAFDGQSVNEPLDLTKLHGNA
jgi:ABC-type ATPase with predicted acetyltransferase domain